MILNVATDGVYNVLQGITGTGKSLFVGYKHDVGFLTDGAAEGYPYYTVQPAFDGHKPVYDGTIQNKAVVRIRTRVYDLHVKTEENAQTFRTLIDLVLTTLQRNTNIQLNGTVHHCLIEDARLGYNEETQPTMHVAEIDCLVTKIVTRT